METIGPLEKNLSATLKRMDRSLQSLFLMSISPSNNTAKLALATATKYIIFILLTDADVSEDLFNIMEKYLEVF